ncbi:MAG: hypothetical protein ACO37W_06865 [Prochlorotrichaceae cyanobacterium]
MTYRNSKIQDNSHHRIQPLSMFTLCTLKRYTYLENSGVAGLQENL